MNFEKSPVLIVAADTIIGLTVMRSLGRHGVPVYCAATLPDALGPQSTYCRGWFKLPGDIEAAVEAIREHVKKWKITHLVGISENHITLLNRLRSELAGSLTFLIPQQEIFERAAKKNLTLECAKKVGVPVPETAYPQTMEEVEDCRRLQFPVILKLAHRPYTPGRGPAFQEKYLRVETMDDLVRTMQALPAGQFPMVQEYIPGRGVGMSMLMRGGKAVLAFEHHRRREYPPAGGVGVVCESAPPNPELLKKSEELLREMGWDGVAMVEYRADPETGRYALMEVNGRFWGSLPTAIHAGAEFPFWLYRTSFPDSPVPPTNYRVGFTARSLAGDTKWLLAVLRERRKSAASAVWEYMSSFSPATRYFLWAWDDPRPSMSNLMWRFRSH